MLSLFLASQDLSTRARTCGLAAAALVTLGVGCGASGAAAERTATHPQAAQGGPVTTPQQRVQRGEPATASSPSGASIPSAASNPSLAQAERSLAQQATLPDILRLVLARNPELAEASQRVDVARELAPAAARLPDLELEYQLWAQPIRRPYALDEAQMHMLGLRQAFPAPGSRSAQAQAAFARTQVASDERRIREQELTSRVRHAFGEYYLADRQYQLHLEHARLSQQVVDVARAVYQGGRGTQRDVLRATLELGRLHNDLAAVDGDRRIARGLLNSLMAREADAPLGPPAALERSRLEVRIDTLDRALSERRPEIAAARGAIAVRASELTAARASARYPSLTLGVQYMYMPLEREPHDYGVMVSMNLPWLNPRYREEVRAAEALLSADSSALSSARYSARYALYASVERLRAARQSLDLIERDLLPQAQQSFESAQAAYQGGDADSLGMLEALRALLDVRLERERALVLVDAAVTDIERAAGGLMDFTHTDGARRK